MQPGSYLLLHGPLGQQLMPCVTAIIVSKALARAVMHAALPPVEPVPGCIGS